MNEWDTFYTRNDGMRAQRKREGNSWATVWENGYNSTKGLSHWGVYVENGNNQFGYGIAPSFAEAKTAASRKLRILSNVYLLSPRMAFVLLFLVMALIILLAG